MIILKSVYTIKILVQYSNKPLQEEYVAIYESLRQRNENYTLTSPMDHVYVK